MRRRGFTSLAYGGMKAHSEDEDTTMHSSFGHMLECVAGEPRPPEERHGVRAQPTGHLLNVLFAAEAKGCTATAAMIRRELRERGEAMPARRT